MSQVEGQLIGREIIQLQEVTSTNDVVAELASSHAEGLVVIAERQTAGRGQYGRRWDSAAGKGLWMSVLLRPQISVSDSARLTSLLAETIAATIEQQANVSTRIKPPNDVYIGDRKVAGVLVEMRVEQGGGYCAIAGMGINVNHTSGDFPEELRNTACSIAMAAERQLDRAAFSASLLQELDRRYAALRSSAPATRDTPAAKSRSA
jgi:BirA family transcriptional regulator, biotin operon repressor / biotin---[acetyl-CoA-carboxylase] ligase